MSARVQYEPEFAWTCAWSTGSPRPFLLVGSTAPTRRAAIERFISSWEPNSDDPVMKAWRRAYREGARCIRVSISPWGYPARSGEEADRG